MRGQLALPPILIAVIAVALAGASPAASERDAHSRGPYPSLGDCPVFPRPPGSLPATAKSLPNMAAWHQNVSGAPVDPRSSRYISYIQRHGTNRVHASFGSLRASGFPYTVVGRSQRQYPVHYTTYGYASDRGPFPIPRSAPVGGGRHSRGDRHVIAVDRATCRLYELFRGFFKRKRRKHWNAASGARWNLRSARRRRDGYTSASGSGLPIFPGLIRNDEIRRGWIDHAIGVTFERTRNAWVHPATHCAGATHRLSAPPMGLRLRLRRDYRIKRFRGAAEIIARALKRYGAIVTDNGSNWFLRGTSDRRWNDGNLNHLRRISGRDFVVVRSAAPIRRC